MRFFLAIDNLKNKQMKRLTLLMAVLVVTSLSLTAQVESSEKKVVQKPTPEEKLRMAKEREQRQQEAAQNNNPDPNAPVITFDKMVHDYGEIPKGGDGTCEFKFKNEGKEPLILSNVRSSCGCTVPSWPRQPILPGESNVIKVKYDTKRVGIINKSIYVYSNAKTSPVTLKIKGKVLAEGATSLPEKKMDKAGAPVNK
ncbi:MAG: DUF1573 domain-containing protein [Bacteroidales bacterium]